MNLSKITSEDIKKYQIEILKNSSASTLDRKIFSLKKFFEWALKEGFVDENPIEEFLDEQKNAIESKLGRIERQKKVSIPSYNSFQARITAKLAGIPKLQKFVYSLFYTRPKWYEKYHNLPIANYFNYAVLIILMSALGFGIYNQFFKTSSYSLAYPTSLTSPGRFLSFQGRLTNKFGNPVTTETDLVFKLYNTEDAPVAIWDSGVCTINPSPDTDGIFSVLLGENCGGEIASSIFSENAGIWLGVTVEDDDEATPRIQIATVAYALNSETLQGYPASESATANTVPVMNNLGQIVLAANSAKIQSTSGTFAIEGQTLSIVTPNTSNGSININPDGTGTLNLIFEGSAPGSGAGGFVNASNTNLSSGALYYGEVANDAGGYNLLNLASGSTPTSKFSVDSGGNITAAGNINGLSVASGTISGGTWNGNIISSVYGGTGANNSAAAQYSIPFYSATGVLGGILTPGSSGYVLSTNGAGSAPTWIEMSGIGGTNYWSLTNGALSPLNSSVDLLIGSNATTSAKFAFTGVLTGIPTASISGSVAGISTFIDGNGHISTTNRGDLVLGNSSAYDSTGNILLNPNGIGNVGIGTTSPLSRLTLISPATNAIGKAAFLIDQYEDQDIFTASSSGQPKMTLTKDGTLNLHNATSTISNISGDITIDAASNIISFSSDDLADIGSITASNLSLSSYATASGSLALGNTNAAAGPGHLNMSGNLVVGGTTTFGGLTYSWPGSQTEGFLVNNGSGTLGWTTSLPSTTTLGFDKIASGTNTSATMIVGAGASLNYTSTGTINASSLTGASWLSPGAIGSGTPNSGAFTNLSASYATFSASLALGNTSAAAGPGHLNMSGNLVVGGTTTFGGLTYSWPGSQTANYVLSTNGTGGLSWVAQTGGGGDVWWEEALGALYTTNPTLDMLLGGNATSSAKIGFLNLNSGTPTLNFNQASRISIADNSSFNITEGDNSYISLSTIDNFESVRFGNTTTNPSFIFNGSGQTILGGNLAVNGGGITSSGALTVTPAAGNNLNISLSGTGDLAVNTNQLYVDTSESRVGIGTSTPTTKLDIEGGLRVAGYATASGSLALGNTNAAAGPGHLNMSGNLVVGGTTTFGGLTYSWPGSQTANYVLSTNGSGGMTWVAQSENFWQRTLGSLSPINITDSLNLGSTATGSALIHLAGTAGENSWINTGNFGIGTTSPLAKVHINGGFGGNASLIINQTTGGDIFTASASGQPRMTLANDGTVRFHNATSMISNSSGDITLDAASGNVAFSGNNLINIGDVIASGILNAGGKSGVAYNTFAGSGDNPASTSITTSNDLFIGGDAEIKGGLFLTGRNIYNVVGGVSTAAITLASSPTSVNNYNTLTYGSWLINNSTNDGIAALMINQAKGGDIFTASASGATKFTIHNDGSITLAGMSSTTNTAEGTIYYDTDVDHLYLRTGDAAWHRLAMDMTKYTANNSSVVNTDYVEIAHNQGTNDLSLVAWFYDTVSSTWQKIANFSKNITHSLQNQFADAGSTGIIRTQIGESGVGLQEGINTGTGSDGAIVVSTNRSINTTNSISGRSCADGGDAVNYNVTALTSTTATLESAPSYTPGNPSVSCLYPGDEILLINLRGVQNYLDNVGNYETLKIQSIDGDEITFTSAKKNFYGNGNSDDTNIGTDTINQIVMLQRVPNYTNVTVNSGINFYPDDWQSPNGGTTSGPGEGGVMFFRASGTVTITGTIHATGKGYTGGAAAASDGSNGGAPGESLFKNSDSSGYGAYSTSIIGNPGSYSGGGGGGKAGTNAGGLGGAGTGNPGAGGGGGGGSVGRYDGSVAGIGGGGGGGGYGTGGDGGNGFLIGGNGTLNQSGSGTSAGIEGTNNSGGGGGGGSGYGTSDLTKLYFGSGGGGGGGGRHGDGTWNAGGTGGNGGGIVLIAANDISVAGGIKSNGSDGNTVGTSVRAGGGGGGAGGSIKLLANNLSLGTNLVTASGGIGGDNTAASSDNDGGFGGNGRIAVQHASSLSGTSSPTFYSSISGYGTFNYGLYHSPVIETPNATYFENISWEETLSDYGKISLQTRTGNSTDPTDGTWEVWKTTANNTNCTSPNCLILQTADTHTDWTGVNATVSDGSVTRNVDMFEDEDESSAGNTAKFVNTSAGSGYAEATLSPAVDISSFDYLTAWIYATASGETVKIGFGETVATEQEETVTIDSPNTWQKVYWDLSDIDSSSKNAVSKLRISNTANPWNTIHFDNIRAEKHLTTSGGSVITSTPNNYFQYRAIFTTTNINSLPALENVSVSYNNGYKIVQTDDNTVRLYNYSGQTQNLRLDAVVFGADLAEYYAVNDPSIGPGDVVAVTGELDEYKVPILRKSLSVKDPGLLGIISTKAGQTLGIDGEDRRLLALAGRVPVKISPSSGPINAGDSITSSLEPGKAKRAVFGEKSIGTALEPWDPESGKETIMVLVGSGNFLTPVISDINSYLLTAKIGTQNIVYSISDSFGEIVENVGVFSNLLAANIKAGAILVGDLTAERADFVIAAVQDFTAPKVAVNLLSPLPGETDIKVEVGNDENVGKFIVQDTQGNEAASIDSLGNAVFGGKIESENLTVNNEATISGTLYAENIESKSLDEIKKLLAEVETDQNLLKEAANWNILTSTDSANLNQLALAELYVTNRAAINSLSITNSLAIGTDMMIQSGSLYPDMNSIDTLSSPLRIQSLAMAPVEIMAGLISIDTSGNVMVAGNLTVGGRISSTGLTLTTGESEIFDDGILNVQGFGGETLSLIDASGSAIFNSISTQGLTIAGGTDATSSAVVNGVITTNSTAGNGTVPAGTSGVTIKNKNVTNYTLVYVTPTSSTDNYVLYVKSKKDGEFVVGFTNPISIDVKFNWWIVKLE